MGEVSDDFGLIEYEEFDDTGPGWVPDEPAGEPPNLVDPDQYADAVHDSDELGSQGEGMVT